MGAEEEIDAKIGSRLMARAGYTYTDAVVQRSFSSDALSPSYNPLFPTIPIGVYSPLVGARPFRVAPHSGFFSLIYSRQKWTVNFAGTLVGRRDDSTFLLDKDFGNTMLLPNRNLDAAYQNLGFTGTYRINRTMSLYATADNLLCERYDESFGYPSLPFNFRAGIRLTIGGESWKKP